jgi:Domain of unknown function (DUF4349)
LSKRGFAVITAAPIDCQESAVRLAKIAVLALLMAAQGCSKSADEAASPRMTSVDIKEEAAAVAPADASAKVETGGGAHSPTPAAIPVSMPKIAYVYDYGYRIAADEISGLQRKHADLCEKQGPQVCRILEMRQSGGEGDYGTGSLNLAVAAPRARSFGGELGKAADSAGGSEVSSAISGEDLSKQIVDTEARLRARSLLRDRLMEVLATRKGTVAELVEAERGVAQVNEEIDQARSWLAEMQGRVDFSRFNIAYASGTPSGGGFVAPIREALGNVGSILGMLIAILIVAATVLVPLGLIGFGIRSVWPRFRRKRQVAEAAAAGGEAS